MVNHRVKSPASYDRIAHDHKRFAHKRCAAALTFATLARYLCRLYHSYRDLFFNRDVRANAPAQSRQKIGNSS